MNRQNKYICLLLDAPLQSWGYQSRFDQRTSLSYPTKSGTIGMLCAAMGVPKSDKSTLAKLVELSMQIYILTRGNNQLCRTIDFHTVGGGYVYPEEKQFISPKADGSKGDTVVTRREYLADAKFVVIFDGEENLIQRIGNALKNPVWGIWCGRKSCIPAALIYQGIYDKPEDALKYITAKTDMQVVKRIVEVDRFEDGTDSLRDVPLDFHKREFAFRRIVFDSE